MRAKLDMVSEFQSLNAAVLSERSPLCDLMQSLGSDKGGPYHNYTVVYDRLFSRFRDSRLNVFELGLGTNKVGAPSSMGPQGKPGASLRGWSAYFENAQIFGADIDADILFQDGRIRSYWVDQRDPKSIRALWEQINNVRFDIMIDDGLHEAPANICFFTESFVKLKSGGIYIIEDVTPQDADLIRSFIATISVELRGIVFEALPHPHNNVDNRLAIFQKA